jgi:hypothetical protein
MIIYVQNISKTSKSVNVKDNKEISVSNINMKIRRQEEDQILKKIIELLKEIITNVIITNVIITNVITTNVIIIMREKDKEIVKAEE